MERGRVVEVMDRLGQLDGVKIAIAVQKNLKNCLFAPYK